MSKVTNIGSRLHSVEQGNVLTGANEILDDIKGKKQNVINSETDAELLRLENEKQNILTFDNAPTEGSNNPVKSGGVYAADKALSDAIEAILLLIPSAATALNKLADKAFVNSSVSTETATFRGTYNVVTDLELAYDATHEQIAAKLGTVILTADNNDYAYVQIPVSATSTDIEHTERYKFNGTAWAYEYDLNTSGFTAAQWEAINSAITTALVQKLAALPTAAELAIALFGKQDNLTFDNAPTIGSNNPVKSSGIKSAINDEKAARENADGLINQNIQSILNLIPTGATSSNKLVDVAGMEAAISVISAVIGDLDATFNIVSTDGHITLNVTQENGLITAVEVQSSDIASAADITLLTNRMTTAEGEINTLTENVSSLNGRVGINERNIAYLQQLYDSLQQSQPEPVTTLPSSGQQQGVIYRLAGTTSYSDYMWNGSDWVLMATYNNAVDPRPKKASQNLVTSGGVFDNMGALDVSELNATENPHTLATYADLSAALAAIPSDDYKKGGMSIKFVHSSDNKYVQYRLMNQNFSTNVDDWYNDYTSFLQTVGDGIITSDKYIYYINGTQEDYPGLMFVTKGVASGMKLKYMYTKNNPDRRGLAFYDIYNNFIEGYQVSPNEQDIIVPDKAVVCRATVNTIEQLLIISTNEAISTIVKNGEELGLSLLTPISAIIAEEGKYINNMGTTIAYNGYGIYSMNVSAGDTLFVTKHAIAGATGLCFFDESDNYISGTNGNVRGLTINKPFAIVVPNNAVKCLLSGKTDVGIEASIANSSDGKDLNILFSTFNKTIFEKKDEFVITLASSNINKDDIYTMYDFPYDGKLHIKYTNTVGAVSKIFVTAKRKNGHILTFATITPSTSYSVIDMSQYIGDIIHFGYRISSADITATGSITVDIKIPSLLNVINDIESDVSTLSSDITNTDTVDRLSEPTVSPIQRIERDFSFGAIFTSFGYVGDSLASGEYNCYKDGVAYHYDAYEYSWGQYLTRWLGVPGVNYTQGGMTAKSWLTNAAHGWPVAKDEPKNAYIIALGVNDTNSISVGNYTTDIDLANYENNADTFAGNYAGIIQRLKSISPRAKFFLLTMPKRNDATTDPVWESYNVQIRAMASVFADVYVLDLYNFAPIFGGEWAVRYNNKFHLCAPGYLYLAFLISSYIDWIVRDKIQEFKEVGLYGTTYSITPTYKLSGVVTNNGNPVSDALVSVGHGKNWYYTKTSSDGSFSINFLSGEYEINVHKSGLTDYSSSFNITENTTINVQLNP